MSVVGLGLLFWCYSRDVLQIGGHGICTIISALKPAPIIGQFSTSPSSNQDLISQGTSTRTIKSREKKNIFS